MLDTTLDEYSVRRERRITGSMNILRLNHLWAFLSVLKESARTVSSVLQRFSGGHDELAATRDGCFEAIRKLVSATEPPQEVMQVDKENRILGDLGLLLESTEGKTPRRLDQPGQPQVQDSQEDDVDDEMIDLLNEMEDAAQCDEKAKPRGLQTERNDSPDHARSASDEKCVSEDDDTLLIQLLDEMEKNLAS